MRHTPAVRRYFDEVIHPMGERNRAQFTREAALGSVVTIPCGDHELPLANADALENATRDFFVALPAKGTNEQ